jgi:hypothetical protein
MKQKPNPILAAIELSLKGQRPLAIMDGWHKESKEAQLEIIRRLFTQETIDEVGCLVLGAVLAGDKQMIAQVRGAIKASDHLFNRDREKELLRPALWYMILHWRGRGLSVEELKAGIEQHCNHGRKLEQHRWSRLRKVLGVQKRSSVRHDRKRVKIGEVGEIIDLAPPLTKRQEKERRAAEERQLARERQISRQAIGVNKALRRRWAKILLEMDRAGRRTSSTKRRKTVS